MCVPHANAQPLKELLERWGASWAFDHHDNGSTWFHLFGAPQNMSGEASQKQQERIADVVKRNRFPSRVGPGTEVFLCDGCVLTLPGDIVVEAEAREDL